MTKYLPEDVFGLRESQIESSNKEVTKAFEKEIEPLEFSIVEGRYDYKLFITTRELSEKEMKEAVQFMQGMRKVNNYFREKNKEKIMDIIDLCTSLIDLKNQNMEKTMEICDTINKISMKMLEFTTYIEEIVGLYEMNRLINTYLNK